MHKPTRNRARRYAATLQACPADGREAVLAEAPELGRRINPGNGTTVRLTIPFQTPEESRPPATNAGETQYEAFYQG